MLGIEFLGRILMILLQCPSASALSSAVVKSNAIFLDLSFLLVSSMQGFKISYTYVISRLFLVHYYNISYFFIH